MTATLTDSTAPSAAGPPASGLPSAAREAVLAQHRALAERLDRLDATIVEIDAGGARGRLAFGSMREQAYELADEFRRHLAYETRYLLPILREIDAWGAERARRVEQEHDEQIELLDFLIRDLDVASSPPQVLICHIRNFAETVRTDMAHEEREVLSDDLLRDDVTAIDASGG